MPYQWIPPRGKPEKKAVFSPHCGNKTTTNYNRAFYFLFMDEVPEAQAVTIGT